ncbi:MAG: ATP-binding protein [Omnitrophica WOR_2 bacterium]
MRHPEEEREHLNLLRRQAEEALRGQPVDLKDLAPEEIQSLLHELQVHQVELTLQNEELRRIQLELETSLDRYSDLYNFAPAGYCTLNRKGRILEANQTLAALLGVEREKLVHKLFSQFVDRDSQDEYYLHRRRTFAEGRRQVSEIRMVKQAGEVLDIRLESVVAHGDETRITVMISDITDRKRAEQALRQAHDELEQRVQERTRELRAAYAELDRNAKHSQTLADVSRQMTEAGVDYLRVTQAFVETTARRTGDACVLRLLSADGQSLDPVAFYHPDPQTLERLNQILIPGTHRTDEGNAGEVFQSGQGKIFNDSSREDEKEAAGSRSPGDGRENGTVSSLIVPLRAKQKVIGTLELISDHSKREFTKEDQIFLQDLADRAALKIDNSWLYRDLEQALLHEMQIRQQLIQAEKFAALSHLVASVVHELNNPLQTIQNCLFLINQDITQPEDHMALEMAISEGKRMSGLLNKLRETYRPSQDISFRSINLVEAVQNVLSLLQPHFQTNQVRCEIYPDQDNYPVFANADQIKEVFINLCINAVDAMRPNGGILKIRISKDPVRSRVQVAIQDSGPGIPPEYKNRLFEPFFTTKEKGTGLGLSISSEIIKNHQGVISADSPPGEGAIFTIQLPLQVQP